MTQDENTKQEQVEEETAEEEVTEEPEAPEQEVTKEAPQEAEAKEEEVPEEIEKEEEKEKPVREKEAEEEIVEERIYTIPLGKAWIMPPRKRTPRAMRMIRAFLMKHMKIGEKEEGEEEQEEMPQLIISNEVNERVWGRGVEKPPRKIRVRAAKDKDGNVTVYLAEGD